MEFVQLWLTYWSFFRFINQESHLRNHENGVQVIACIGLSSVPVVTLVLYFTLQWCLKSLVYETYLHG